MTIYNWSDTWEAGDFPTVLAIGDSWFWYPKFNNLLNAISNHPKLKTDYRSVVRIGKNGAPLSSFVDVDSRPGRFSNELNAVLSPDTAHFFTILIVSGAGNDAVDYSLALKENCAGLATAEECLDSNGLQAMLKSISQSLGILLHEAICAFQNIGQPIVIIMHGYDYPVPDGRGFDIFQDIELSGPWLSTAMDTCGVAADMELRKNISHILIDRLAELIKQYADTSTSIYFVDSRGTLRSDEQYEADWDNELHPTASGFATIVEQRWVPVLQSIGIMTT